jgi:hypothetical protein
MFQSLVFTLEVHLVHGSNHALYLRQYHYLSHLNLVLNVYLSPIHTKIKNRTIYIEKTFKCHAQTNHCGWSIRSSHFLF